MTTRTITLTGRPPVKIHEEDWPVIAEAVQSDWDNQYEFQANRKWSWTVKVRQHEDGRTLVYAAYSYTSNFQDERGYSAKHGVLLDAEDATTEGVCRAIESVCSDMADAEADDDYSARWKTLAAECIADLPAEEL